MINTEHQRSLAEQAITSPRTPLNTRFPGINKVVPPLPVPVDTSSNFTPSAVESLPSYSAPPLQQTVFAPPPFSFWAFFCRVTTFWAPSFMLANFGMTDPLVQQAWREKVTLCIIIFIICLMLGFLTFGLQPALCPSNNGVNMRVAYSVHQPDGTLQKIIRQDSVVIYGGIYSFANVKKVLAAKGISMPNEFQGLDVSALFDSTNGACASWDQAANFKTPCRVNHPYGGAPLEAQDSKCLSPSLITGSVKPIGQMAFEWYDIAANNLNPSPQLIVYGNSVLNMSNYVAVGSSKYFGNLTTRALEATLGQDGSKVLVSNPETKAALRCIVPRYTVGILSTQSFGCFAVDAIQTVALAVIVTLIVTRFVMAIVFSWTMRSRLTKVTKTADREVHVRGDPLYTVMLVTCYCGQQQILR